jgi:hypothetical protein
LDGTDVVARFQQVRREGMSQRVDRRGFTTAAFRTASLNARCSASSGAWRASLPPTSDPSSVGSTQRRTGKVTKEGCELSPPMSRGGACRETG